MIKRISEHTLDSKFKTLREIIQSIKLQISLLINYKSEPLGSLGSLRCNRMLAIPFPKA